MRKKLIQLVHIGKSQLGIDDESWRALLSYQFYQNSTKNVSDKDLLKLVSLLQQKGAKIRLPSRSERLLPILRKLWATWQAMAADGVISDGSSNALDAYVRRHYPNVKHWTELNNNEPFVILETLKQWHKRVGN